MNTRAIQTEEFAQNVLETIHEPLLILDGELHVLFANRSFYRCFQVIPEATEGQLIYEIGNHQWNSSPLRELFKMVVESQIGIENYEIEHDFPTIGRRTMKINARVVISKAKEKLILLAINDITTRRKYEQQRDAALKAREQLVSVVSHEIKNPLTTIKTSLELIRRSLTKSVDLGRLNLLLEQCDTAIERMVSITSNLLDVTMFEGGHFVLYTAPTPLHELMASAAQDVKALAARRSISVSFQVIAKVKKLSCDPERIEQILSHLIANAIKFTREGGTVLVKATQREKNIYFEVIDNGIGIAEINLVHIFDRFWQEKQTQYLGSGLGLYIAKMFVEAHGGNIGVESKEGFGSRFYFTVPIFRASA